MEATFWTALANRELFVDSKFDWKTFRTLDWTWVLDEDPAPWLKVEFFRSLLCLCYDGELVEAPALRGQDWADPHQSTLE